MKKTLFFSFTLLFITFAVINMNAQTTLLLDEDFNGTDIPAHWLTYNIGDAACNSENWTFGSGIVPGGGTGNDFSTNAAIFNDDSYGSDSNHNKSVLYYGSGINGVDLSLYGGPIIFSYEYALNVTSNGSQNLQVAIWDNTNTTWITLKTYDADAEPTADFVDLRPALISNSGINQEQVYVGFIYDDISGSWGWGAGVDNVQLAVYAAPSNDSCAGALNVGTIFNGTGVSGTVDASGATNNDGFITTCTDAMNDGVWYYFYASYDGEVTVDVSPGDTWDAQIGVFSGSDCNSLTCVGTMDDNWNNGGPESYTFPVESGNTYYINIGHYSASIDYPEGIFELSISYSCTGASVPNDLIADAIEITDPTFSDTVNVPCANAESGNFTGCTYGNLKTAFYKFHTTGSSTVVAQILTPTGISAAEFYEAPSLNAAENELVRVDQASNPCTPGNTYSIVTEANKNYYVVLSNGSETTITINGVENNTGVSDQTIAGLKMYPNPVNDALNIDAPETIKEISVYNIAGQKVFHTIPEEMLTSIATGDWATGTYIVKIITENNTGVYHIMKE